MEGKQGTIFSNKNSIMILIYNDFKLKSNLKKKLGMHLNFQLYSIYITGF